MTHPRSPSGSRASDSAQRSAPSPKTKRSATAGPAAIGRRRSCYSTYLMRQRYILHPRPREAATIAPSAPSSCLRSSKLEARRATSVTGPLHPGPGDTPGLDRIADACRVTGVLQPPTRAGC
ncbi:hypothetical protein PYCCODRAFT_1304703 [Trametes coccinea BRFM310]|uniref:Uncharacterized protein n=1 Tax=Trametes coccinea (strain BRFM310) TaxID=1353009 RepID=A0A1Y2I5U8_TRAC3|nr:hypothetical protein PYCCODRAFT_1304703 [Trametes coccinea BRFM310]